MNTFDTTPTLQADIEATILTLTTQRGPAKSICPSEVARALRADWQSLLTEVRRVACRMATTGQIEILRKGHPVEPIDGAVEPSGIKGVIRLRWSSRPVERLA